MRLWHSKLLPLLDNKRLCDTHMSCCNLRGLGWGKRNVAIDYLYDDPLGEDALYEYHLRVLNEMEWRGFQPNESWFDPHYCGKKRPKRNVYSYKAREAESRNVPLKGHGLKFFKNDVAALQERGLPLAMTYVMEHDPDYNPFAIYTVRNVETGKEITYGVRVLNID